MLLEASNQQEAIQRIRTTSPDLILLDIDKSVRQENTILQDFKTNKITGAIPVLFITSMTSENHIPECLNYDNIDFITKPSVPKNWSSGFSTSYPCSGPNGSSAGKTRN